MTAQQMNADIFRSLGIIAEDEHLLARACKYLKRLASSKEDETLLTREEFFAKVDRAIEQAGNGEGVEFNDSQIMNAWLNSL